VWEFEHGTRIVLHLSQAGRLDIEQPPRNKTRGSAVRFVFSRGENDLRGRYRRPRARVRYQRKASWWVLAPGEEDRYSDLGPSRERGFAAIIRTSDSRRRLTTDLRDQHFVSGIGRGWVMTSCIAPNCHRSPRCTR